jgi:hypothetical protein
MRSMRTRPIWHGEEHPRRIDQDRQPKRPQSETDIHWVTGEAIKPVCDDPRARIERDRISAGTLLVINPPMFSAIPAPKNSAPSVHRTAPCTKLVGTNHSNARDARIGRTNRSGGAMGTPGRSSSGGSSEDIGLIEMKLNREMVGRDAN